MANRNLRFLVACLTLLLLGAAATAHCGEYRRVFVPADKPELWPTQDRAYVPAAREEVKRLLQVVDSAPARPGLAIEQAEWWATPSGSRVVGHGLLTVKRVGREKVFLRLPAASIRVTAAEWNETGDPVLLGDWPAEDGMLYGALIQRDGTLRINFEVESRSPGDAAPTYQIDTPVAVVNSLLLDLPPAKTPRPVTGDVQRVGPSDTGGDAPPLPQGWARWRLRAPPGAPYSFAIDDDATPEADRRNRFSYATTTHCEASEAGLSIETRFALEGERALPGSVRIQLRDGFSPTTVEQDGLPAEWRPAEAPGVIRVTLRSVAAGSPTTLQVTCLAPLNQTGENQATAAVLPEGRWLEGRIRVRAHEPLSIVDVPVAQQVVFDASHQTPSGSPGVQATGVRQVNFLMTAAEPRLGFLVASETQRRRLTVSRSVSIDKDRAQVRVSISAEPGDTATLPVRVLPLRKGWRLFDVQSSAGLGPVKWTLDRHGDSSYVALDFAQLQGAEADAPRTLTLLLTRPVTDLLDPQEILAEALLAVDLSDLPLRESRMRIEGSQDVQIALRSSVNDGAATSRVTEPIELQFIGPGARGDAGAVRLWVRRSEPQATGCRILVRRDQRHWGYRCQLQPAPTLREVRFQPGLPSTATLRTAGGATLPAAAWNAQGEDDAASPVTVLRIPGQGSLAAQPLQISFSAPVNGPLPIPLPRLGPEGQGQGEVILPPEICASATVRQTGLKPSAGLKPEDSRFLFDLASAEPQAVAIGLTPVPASRENRLGIKLLALQTRLHDSGRTSSLAEVTVDPPHREVTLQLPTDQKLQSVFDANGGQVPYSRLDETRFVCHLPGDLHTVLRLQYENANRDWRDRQGVTPALPIGVQTTQWQWRLITPNTYTIAAPGRQDWLSRRGDGWQSWGLGPPGDRSALPPFNPFRLGDWQQQLAGLAPVGTRATDPTLPASSANARLAGWNTTELTVMGGGVSVRVYDRIQLGIAMLLVAGAASLLTAGPWSLPRRLPIALVFIAWGVAIVAPPTMAPWVLSAAVGLSLGLLLGRLFSWTTVRREPSQTETASRASTVTYACLLLLPTVAHSAPAPPPRVLIPVDETREAVGDKWYLDANHLRRLRAVADRLDAAPAEWVVHSQRVRGLLAADSTPTAEPTPWTITLELSTLYQDALVRLPFQQSQAQWRPRALVDGSSVAYQWAPDGQALFVRAPEPGKHAVVLSLSPHIERSSGQSCLRLHLADCSRTSVRVETGEAIREVHGVDTPLRLKEVSPGEFVHADWPGQQPLAICWTETPNGAVPLLTRCDVIQWLTVGPDNATLRTRWLVKGGAPLPRVLRLPPANGRPARLLAPDTPWGPTQRELAYTDATTLPRTTSLGAVSLPIEVPSNVTLDQRYLAVSSADGLAVTQQARDNQTAVAPRLVTRLWGADPGDLPALAVKTDATHPLVLEVKPLDNDPMARSQELTLNVGLQAVHCRYRATLVPGAWPLGRIVVSLPQRFTLAEVALQRGEQDVPASVSTLGGPDRLVLLCAEPQSGQTPLEVRVRGSVQGPVQQTPILRLLSERSPLAVTLTGESGVEIALDHEATSNSPRSGSISFRLETDQSPVPAMQVAASNDAYTAAVLSRHTPSTGPAGVRVDAVLDAVQSDINSFEIAARRIDTQVALQAPENARIVRSNNSQPGRWTVRLAQPIPQGESGRISMEVTLPGNSTPRHATPIWLPGATRQTDYVVLEASQENGAWVTEALEPTAHGEAASSWGVKPGTTLYRETQPGDGRVSWKPNPTGHRVPLLAARDLTVRSGDLGSLAINAAFTIDPDGASSCIVRLPAGYAGAQWLLNGAPPALHPLGERKWNVSFRDTQQPQNLVIRATVTPATPATLSFPSIENAVAPTGSLLSVYGSGATVVLPPETATTIQLEEAQRWRRVVAAAIAEDATRSDASGTNRQETNGGSAPPELVPTRSQGPDPAGALLGGDADAAVRVYQLSGPSAPTVRVQTRGASNVVARWILAVTLFAGALVWWLRQPHWNLGPSQSEGLAAIIGLAWWLWLPLSAIGFCVLIAAGVAGLVLHRRRIASRF